MEDRTVRKVSLELVKPEDKDLRTSSGVVPSLPFNDGTATTSSLGITTGVILEGKYLVGRIIGSGAVGIVFEAKNVELDEKVAIKCLRPEMLIDSGMVARFAREAKAAAAIKSEYCATVHDVGQTSEGVPYIVMEFLEGKDLGTVVAESGTIGPRTAVEYALQVCEALAVAHSKGIVHRDIKPENLLLTERAGGMRIVKVLDFGISKTALTGSIFKNELPLVKTMNLMGTPLYMSPEQVRISDSVDVRSDIWSLGMVIYEILTGQTAFGGASITEICASILESAPKPIELHRNDLPSGLVDVIHKCLQKDANRRFQNIAELALALMPFGPKRTRLNVERAVAVLQGSGQLDKSVRVNSTVPPAHIDYSLVPIPKPSSVPGMTPSAPLVTPLSSSSPMMAAASGTHDLLSSPMLPVPVPAETATTLSYPPPKKKPIALFIGAGVILLVGVAAAASTLIGANNKKAEADRSTPAPTVAIATQTATAAVTPTPTPPAPTVAETATAAAAATPTPTPPAAVTPAAKPAWATFTARPTAPQQQPRGNVGVSAIGGRPAPAGGTTTTTTPKPKATGKPGEEPDLGY